MILRAAAWALLLAGCGRPAPELDLPKLDLIDRRMLDPRREKAIQPDALVARLALRPDAVVADVGAGPGLVTLPLARAVPRGRVIATDVRARSLEALAARARAAGIENIETRIVPGGRPELAPGSIDLALLCQVDQLLRDRVGYFRALAATLKPGGRIAIVNLFSARAASIGAATAAGLRVTDEWRPSPLYFAAVLAPGEGR